MCSNFTRLWQSLRDDNAIAEKDLLFHIYLVITDLIKRASNRNVAFVAETRWLFAVISSCTCTCICVCMLCVHMYTCILYTKAVRLKTCVETILSFLFKVTVNVY